MIYDVLGFDIYLFTLRTNVSLNFQLETNGVSTNILIGENIDFLSIKYNVCMYM